MQSTSTNSQDEVLIEWYAAAEKTAQVWKNIMKSVTYEYSSVTTILDLIQCDVIPSVPGKRSYNLLQFTL